MKIIFLIMSVAFSSISFFAPNRTQSSLTPTDSIAAETPTPKSQTSIVPSPENITQSSPSPSNSKQKINCAMPRPSPLEEASPEPTPKPTPKEGPLHYDKPLTIEQFKAKAKQLDWDCDGVSNYDDNCLAVPNSDQKDKNKNGLGDACEPKRRKYKRRPR